MARIRPNRKAQRFWRDIVVKRFMELEWRGSNHEEIMEILEREGLLHPLRSIYDMDSVMVSRFIRTLTRRKKLGKGRERIVIRDSDGRYWDRTDEQSYPQAVLGFQEVEYGQLAADLNAYNREREEMHRRLGLRGSFRRLRIVTDNDH